MVIYLRGYKKFRSEVGFNYELEANALKKLAIKN